MQNRSRFLPLLALLPCVALLLSAQLSWPLVSQWQGDLEIYARYADQIVQGQLPYRDFTVEYPPLALVPFVMPRLLVLGRPLDETQYRLLFLLQNAFYFGLTTWVTLLIGRRSNLRTLPLALMMTLIAVILSPLLAWRFDVFPALISSLALLAVVQAQPLASGAWHGVGVAVKLYPVVLGPIVGLYYLVTKQWRAVTLLVLGGILALAVSVLPFFLIDRAGLLAFLEYHDARGIQIESVTGGIISLGAVYHKTDVELVFNYGALHLISPWADALLPWHTPALILVYALLLLAAFIGFRATTHPLRLMTFSLAALLAFIVTNKVFSPQYIVWLVPFVPLLSRRQFMLFVAICAATVVIFPFRYDDLLSFTPSAVWLLNARNMATIALFLWVVHSGVVRDDGGRLSVDSTQEIDGVAVDSRPSSAKA